MRKRLLFFAVLFVVLLLVIDFGVMIKAFGGGFVVNKQITGVVKEEGRSPRQLFDIRFEVEDSVILGMDDLVSRVIFESFGSESTQVDLNFFILDELNNIVYSSDDSIVVETERVFTKSFEGIDLEVGNYVLFLNTLYNGNIKDEFWQGFEIQKRSLKSLFQLFDISIEIENSFIEDTDDLFVRVIFESFGNESSPVSMEFIFLDSDGKEVFREVDHTIVETDRVFTKSFSGRRFKEGEYTLVLKTLYNVDVADEFRKKFSVNVVAEYSLFLWVSGIVNILLIIFVFALLRERKGFM